MWCIPPKQSAEFVYHMEDVLEVYHRPHDPGRPVVCVDETFKQLIGETREPLPPSPRDGDEPGRVERYDSVYERNGVASVFMAFEPLAGWRRAAVTGGRTAKDFASFVRELLDGRYRGAGKVVLVMDQLNTHTPASLYALLPPGEAKRLADRLEVHHTPKHGSWLNMAEVELSALARDLPDRIGDEAAMVAHVGAWEQRRNRAKVQADWQFTTADARIELRKLYPTVDG
jgi:hypothetical protein